MPVEDYLPERQAEWDESGRNPVEFFTMLLANGTVTWADIERERAFHPSLRILKESPITGLPEQTRLSIGDALFNKVSSFFQIQWDGVWQRFTPVVHKIVTYYIDYWKPIIRKIALRLFDGDGLDPRTLQHLPQAMKIRLKRFQGEPTITDGFILSVYGLLYDLGKVLGFIAATNIEAQHAINKEIAPEIPDIGTLLTVYMRYDGDRNLVVDKARQLGYDKTEIELFLKAIQPLLDPLMLRGLLLRGHIDEKEHDLRLYRQGYSTTQISYQKELYKLIPGPSDLISMAVREAWEHKYAEKWGSDKQFPPEFQQWMQAQGFTPEWSKLFWRAHWNIPSVEMGFDMLHRGVIDQQELDQLMMALDIMPGWRERLTDISYRLLTRVDVRRMFRVGVLNREEVKEAYLKLGYDDLNAERMTEFTIRFVSEEERDLTKSDILAVYKRRMIDDETAKALLVNMGYDPIEASVLTARIDYDLVKGEKDTIIKNLGKAYKRGIITEADVYTRTTSIAMPRTEAEALILQWDLETADARTPLSRADLDRLVKGKVITKEEYAVEIHILGYSVRDTNRLVKLIK